MNLEFFVSRRKLTCKGTDVPITDTAACDTFTIAFDEEWEGLVRIVTLENGEHSAQVVYTGKTPLPAQVCGRGQLRLTCRGYRSKGDTVAVVTTAPMVRPVMITGSTRTEAADAQPYTPSAYAQIVALVAQAQETAKNAEETAQELLKLKQSGAFDGAPGIAATVQVEQVRYGETAKVENLGTSRNAILRFTLPYKMSEQEQAALAEQLRLSLVGDMDTALEGILQLQQNLIGGEQA